MPYEMDLRTMARLWGNVAGVDHENTAVALEVERNESDEVAIHLFIDGRGSEASYYLNRDAAIEVATRLLLEARTR